MRALPESLLAGPGVRSFHRGALMDAYRPFEIQLPLQFNEGTKVPDGHVAAEEKRAFFSAWKGRLKERFAQLGTCATSHSVVLI